MTVEELVEELLGRPNTAMVVVKESGNRRAVPLDIEDVDYAAGEVVLYVDTEALKRE